MNAGTIEEPAKAVSWKHAQQIARTWCCPLRNPSRKTVFVIVHHGSALTPEVWEMNWLCEILSRKDWK